MTASTDIQVLMVILDEVRTIRQDNSDFKTELKQDLQAFKTELKQDISELKSEVRELQIDVIGLKHDVSGLYHWDYWLLSIILVVFAMPQIVVGIKSLFSAIIDGVAGIISLFRH